MSASAWSAQAAHRTARAGGAPTPEDQILRALLEGDANALEHAAHLRANAPLLDHDYLAYWVDELALQGRWRALA